MYLLLYLLHSAGKSPFEDFSLFKIDSNDTPNVLSSCPFCSILGIPFILCFLCKLYQLDINRRERIRKKELESSPGLTRNQPKFNLLNCQENFQDQNGFNKNHNEFHQDQNGFHQVHQLSWCPVMRTK